MKFRKVLKFLIELIGLLLSFVLVGFVLLQPEEFLKANTNMIILTCWIIIISLNNK